MHFNMPVQIDDKNCLTFTTPDGQSSTKQYPADWTTERIIEDFRTTLAGVPNVKNVSVRRVADQQN